MLEYFQLSGHNYALGESEVAFFPTVPYFVGGFQAILYTQPALEGYALEAL